MAKKTDRRVESKKGDARGNRGKPLKFTMRFKPMTIEHLGLRLYSTLPPVISELVSNAHDAESPKVEISIPTGSIQDSSEVRVRDWGHGMDASALQDEYLPIGRNRRGEDGTQTKSKHGKVTVTGRKGLGKLSAFGVANVVEIRSICDGQAIALRLVYSEMQAWAKNESADYEPTIVPELTGPTDEADGVEIVLRELRRHNAISEDVVRRGLAKRLRMIGPNFDVLVNGKPVQPGDRTSRKKCVDEFSWSMDQLPTKGRIGERYSVHGWIGFVATSSQTDRGIDIFANNKAVELASYFNYPSTHAQFARAHLVGEVHADFLDGSEDLVSTARSTVVWESIPGQALQDWGHETLKWVFDQWLTLRRKEKESKVIRHTGFDQWLESRAPRERNAARKMVKLLIDDERIDADSAKPLLEIVKSSVETVAFQDLVSELEEGPFNVARLLELFRDWRLIEAREHLHLADGRLAAVEKLEHYLEAGALEVQQLQPLLVENIWLIDPTWTEAAVELRYSKLLRDYAKRNIDKANAPEVDRRIDILGVTHSGIATVVEIKHTKKVLNRDILEQIERYVDFMRTQIIGTSQESPVSCRGLLIVGHLSKDAEVVQKMTRLAASDIRVKTFGDLHRDAKTYCQQVERRLETVAPEYTRGARQTRAAAKKGAAKKGAAKKGAAKKGAAKKGAAKASKVTTTAVRERTTTNAARERATKKAARKKAAKK